MTPRLTAVLTTAVVLVTSVTASASQLIRRSLAELGSGSEVIFVGRCDAVTAHWNDDHSLILTANHFRVSRPIKGDPGESFTVEELGGTVGGTTLQVLDVPRFRAGEEVLLCLHRTALGRWETYGATQGRFEVSHDSRGRIWVRNDQYPSELTAMAPVGTSTVRGAPLTALAGFLRAALPSRGLRP